MNRLLMIALLAAPLGGCHTPTAMDDAIASGWSHYGFTDRDRGRDYTMGELAGGEYNAVVTGEITEVCAIKGCWMRVRSGEEELFVRFQDYAFFVPRNAAGHQVVFHGTALRQEMSVEELRHYAEDAKKSPEEIAAITEPEVAVVFFADSVRIEGDDLDPPYGAE